mmetsp:Transcript_25430/g.39882  ORF Transcript_25430/g.39882 Transcript_25430/m.39882 type:complete len:274 (+) Transcript_25430:631-1452(+)|eukprot:CAMPEP_0184307782 /NCGR_PEP_ID=MMETSP1049-20130417/16429_1 /TAXON_ID=77928 /ORGANISM="Proteomonas sulcata, Strain CCMP704" /LENGTH=273 /DNA_ID=CAMNT_0026620351 /DNA_START=395 /DNA_END=1216 /DNA_ORIENTATION=-
MGARTEHWGCAPKLHLNTKSLLKRLNLSGTGGKKDVHYGGAHGKVQVSSKLEFGEQHGANRPGEKQDALAARDAWAILGKRSQARTEHKITSAPPAHHYSGPERPVRQAVPSAKSWVMLGQRFKARVLAPDAMEIDRAQSHPIMGFQRSQSAEAALDRRTQSAPVWAHQVDVVVEEEQSAEEVLEQQPPAGRKDLYSVALSVLRAPGLPPPSGTEPVPLVDHQSRESKTLVARDIDLEMAELETGMADMEAWHQPSSYERSLSDNKKALKSGC